MSTQKNLITLCFAAVFTLGLAACGGGGGGAPVTGPEATQMRPIAGRCDQGGWTSDRMHADRGDGRDENRRPTSAVAGGVRKFAHPA